MHLLKSIELSVIEELMPLTTKEVRHYHSISQQFFYILKGEATFDLEDQELKISKREGIHIKPNMKHRIRNDQDSELQFLVVSQPTTMGDRNDLDESSIKQWPKKGYKGLTQF